MRLSPESRALHLSFLLYNSNYDRFISNRCPALLLCFSAWHPVEMVTLNLENPYITKKTHEEP